MLDDENTSSADEIKTPQDFNKEDGWKLNYPQFRTDVDRTILVLVYDPHLGWCFHLVR